MKCLYGTPIPPPSPSQHIRTCYTGPDPTVGAFLAGRRQTIVGIPPTPDQLQHLSQLAEQGRQQGGGGAEGGPDVNGSASGLGATPNMIVQNESMHPQPIHHHPPRELEEAWLVYILYQVIVTCLGRSKGASLFPFCIF